MSGFAHHCYVKRHLDADFDGSTLGSQEPSESPFLATEKKMATKILQIAAVQQYDIPSHAIHHI